MTTIFPKIHSFPPFYTLQINERTRSHQIDLWKEVILMYCKQEGKIKYDLNELLDSNLFNNRDIQRRVKKEEATKIIDALVEDSNAFWIDSNGIYIFTRPMASIANQIYESMVDQGKIDTILTIYELLESPENKKDWGLDEGAMIKVLQQLGKKVEIKRDQFNLSHSGVKFFQV